MGCCSTSLCQRGGRRGGVRSDDGRLVSRAGARGRAGPSPRPRLRWGRGVGGAGGRPQSILVRRGERARAAHARSLYNCAHKPPAHPPPASQSTSAPVYYLHSRMQLLCTPTPLRRNILTTRRPITLIDFGGNLKKATSHT